MDNEQEKFLADLTPDENADPFAGIQAEPEPSEPANPDEDPELAPDSVKNRRHKRLEEKLQAEREANIALTERLKTLAEVRGSTTQEAIDYLKNVERIYGTETPEAQMATQLLQDALKKVEDRAYERSLETIRQEREKEKEAVAKEDKALDSMLEDLEDETGMDLTSAKSESTRKGFFKLLERMSPKDADGNIVAYADHFAVWEAYQARSQRKPDSRAKDLAARGTVRSGQGGNITLDADVNERWLKENNII
jgi:hypothetical protein